MAGICAVILDAGTACGSAADVIVSEKSLIDWALDAACAVSESVFVSSEDEAVIAKAANRAESIGCGIAELVKSIAGYDRAVMFALNQLVSKEDAKKLAESSAPCAVLVHEGKEMLAWSVSTRFLMNATSIKSLFDCVNAQYIEADEYACAAVTGRKTQSLAESAMQRRIKDIHFENGVSIIQPETVYIGADVEIGENVVIWPNNTLTGKTKIGKNTVLKPGCNINESTVGEDCVLNFVFANEAKVGNRVTIGPYVNLRPKTNIADGCKIGDFVEVKNSNVGKGTKLPHLSYIGDADVGERVNVGCGCVFVNYDGVHKHRTVVGNDVFLGCQTNLVAPVSVGDGAYTAAGSTINKDVPADAMAFARARQQNKEGYASRYKALKKGE